MSAEQLLTDAELAAIAERASKATPGPWRIGAPFFQCLLDHPGERHGAGKCRYTFQGWQESDSHEIHRDISYTPETEHTAAHDGQICGHWDYDFGGVVREADAAFIAAAREDVPRLLADNQHCREWLRRFVACFDGAADLGSDLQELGEEVRAALKGTK